MAKELPYFRFTAQEWQNGDISLESYEMKGLFVDICSYYWLKDCSITKAILEKRFKRDSELLNELLELEIIKHDEETDFLVISFLNEQFDLLSEQRKRRQQAGKKGGKQKSSNAKAKPKQNPSYKDKDKDNYNNKYKKSLLSEINISDITEEHQNYFKIANTFQEIIKTNLIEKEASTKNIDNTKGAAIDEIRLLIESDKYTIENCRTVATFLKEEKESNGFAWKNNILSIKTLREKFDKLIIASNTSTKQTQQQTSYGGKQSHTPAVEIGETSYK